MGVGAKCGASTVDSAFLQSAVLPSWQMPFPAQT